MRTLVAAVLNSILAGDRFTAADLAQQANCSESMIYRVRNEEAELCTSKVQALAVYLSRAGDTRLSRCFLSPEYDVVKRAMPDGADGRIDDDVARLVDAAGALIRSHEGGNPEAWNEGVDAMKRAMQGLDAEGHLRFAPNA